MSGTTPALLAAAAGVGFGHAILPDHWVPLAVLGRTRGYPLGRVARLCGLAAIAHVLVSIVLGAVIVVIGLQFRSQVEHAQAAIVGGLLLVTGVALALLEITGHAHGHTHPHVHAHTHEHDPEQGEAHTHGHTHDPEQGEAHEHIRASPAGVRGVAAVMVPFGAAASPDLTILPVFLAATAAGPAAAIGALAIFSVTTIATIMGLTLLATFGGYQLRGQWLERWGNVLTALVLVLIGLLVLTGII